MIGTDNAFTHKFFLLNRKNLSHDIYGYALSLYIAVAFSIYSQNILHE